MPVMAAASPIAVAVTAIKIPLGPVISKIKIKRKPSMNFENLG